MGNSNAHHIDRVGSSVSRKRYSTRLRSSVVELSGEVGFSTIARTTITTFLVDSIIITNLNIERTCASRLICIVSNNNLRNIVVLVGRSCTCTSSSGCYLYAIVEKTCSFLIICPVSGFTVLCSCPSFASKDVSRCHVFSGLWRSSRSKDNF